MALKYKVSTRSVQAAPEWKMYVQTKPCLQINTLGRCVHGENNMVQWLGTRGRVV